MTTWKVIPMCLALMVASMTTAAAQHTHHSGSDDHQGDEHVTMGLFEELNQGDYSDAEMVVIHAHFDAIHQSIDEIIGLHDHEGPTRDPEELHDAGEDAFNVLLDAYESIVAELEEDHARTFTGMLFQHLIHTSVLHGHGGDGQAPAVGPHGHG